MISPEGHFYTLIEGVEGLEIRLYDPREGMPRLKEADRDVLLSIIRGESRPASVLARKLGCRTTTLAITYAAIAHGLVEIRRVPVSAP